MTMPHPFRFGVIAEQILSRGEFLETARRAEDAGYSTFLIRDHYIEEDFGQQLAPVAALATVAALTTTLRIGSMVFAIDYRNPVMLAKEVSTLDLLSNGRFELGLGAGFSRMEYERAGIAYDPPAVRVERFAEAIQVLKGLFGDDPFSFRGKHFTISDLDAFPKPVQRPRPPIIIGAGGKRMLAIAAREADTIGILTSAITDGTLHHNDPTGNRAASIMQKLDWLRRAAGQRFPAIELSLFCSVIIAADRKRAAEDLARARGWGSVSAGDVLEMPTVFIGSVEQIADEMQMRRERYGVSYYILRPQDMAAAAPLVTRLSGK